MSIDQPDFKKINFGKADAINEGDLLIDAFLDTEGYIDQIIAGEKYFVIGQKGSGKTAIASKLKLLAANDKNLVVSPIMLDEFDYSGFSGVIPGSSSLEERYTLTWEFLLALKLIELYPKSKYSVSESKYDPKGLVKGLEALGVLPNDLKSIIGIFKTKEFTIDIKLAKYVSTRADERMDAHSVKKLINTVQKSVYNIFPNAMHLIVIDGLDSIFTKRENQYEILSSLISSTDRINHKFRDLNIKARIVVLCRKDVLDKLNDPNRSKYIQDSGIELNWYQGTANIKDTNLYKLINLRAQVSLKKDVDVMETYFPPEYSGRETFRALIDNTRYTPRDIIQLMNKIQSVSYGKGASTQTIRDGINLYSDRYFLMEIKDSLVGLLSNDEIETAFQTIIQLGVVEFSYAEFRNICPMGDKALKMLSALYVAGAISNIDNDEDGATYRVNAIRNPYSSFNQYRKIIVNSGLRKALMIH